MSSGSTGGQTNGVTASSSTSTSDSKTEKRNNRDPANEVGDVNVCRVYICHLPPTFSSADLLKMFSPYGKILESKVLVDPRTGRSRGVAFVHYEKKEEAQSAITAVNGTKLDNHPQTLQARFARVSQERGSGRSSRRRGDPYDRDDRGRRGRGRRGRRDDYDDYDDYDDDYGYDRRPSRGSGIRGSGYYDREHNRGGYTLYTAPGARTIPPPPPPSSSNYPPSSSSNYPPPSSSYPPSTSSYPPNSGYAPGSSYNPYGRSSYGPPY